MLEPIHVEHVEVALYLLHLASPNAELAFLIPDAYLAQLVKFHLSEVHAAL